MHTRHLHPIYHRSATFVCAYEPLRWPFGGAARFKEHFSELYGKEEWYDETVLHSIPQHDPKVWEDQGQTPDSDEIKVVVRRLNVSGPGITGISAAVLKALLLHDEAFSCLVEVVLHFWESEEVPAQWEECLLEILPKSGELSQPDNYRDIMLLKVLLKGSSC